MRQALRSTRQALGLGGVLSLVLMLAGCGGGSAGGGGAGGSASSAPVLSGKVYGDNSLQRPISGSTVTFYAMGSIGYGAGASVLATATSDSTGNFTIGSYTCPSATVETYVTATGGNAGAGTNSAIGLMAITGQCGSPSSSSFVVLNELTTVAAEWELAQFSDSTGTNFGTSSGNAIGLDNAINQTISDLVVSVGTGISNTGIPASFLPTAAQCSSSSPPVNCDALERLDTLANVLASCINTSGPTSTHCNTLFSNTNNSKTTLEAAREIVTNPATNVAAIYGISPPAGMSVFSPTLSSAASDWTLALNFSGGGLDGPAAIAIDGLGDAWVANDGGVVVEFAPDGRLLSGCTGFSGGGLSHSFGIAISSSGNVWVANKYAPSNNGSVTELSAGGAILSPTGGYTAGNIDYPEALAFDASGNLWIANYANASVTRNPTSAQNFVVGGLSVAVCMAMDGSGDVWTTNFGSSSVTELGPDGSPISGSGGYTAGGLDGPAAIEIDADGHAWVANYYGDSVTELDASGAAVSGAPYTGGGLSGPAAIAIDGGGDVWVANYSGDSITELEGSLGAVPGSPMSGKSGYTGGGLVTPNGVAIDASGNNLWTANFSANSVTEFVGVAVPVTTPLFGPPQRP